LRADILLQTESAFDGHIELFSDYLEYASSGMFRQFFIERDKGPIHPDGRRCPP
jgi:hypothetical protein